VNMAEAAVATLRGMHGNGRWHILLLGPNSAATIVLSEMKELP
jgi:hypothetical protein